MIVCTLCFHVTEKAEIVYAKNENDMLMRNMLDKKKCFYYKISLLRTKIKIPVSLNIPYM